MGEFIEILTATFLTIILFIVWLPFYIYKTIIIMCVKKFKSTSGSFGRALTDFDIILIDNFTRDPVNASPLAILKLERKISLKDLTDTFTKNVLNAKITTGKSSKESITRYPELKQTLARFMGCWFWKDDPNFHLTNKIFELDVETNAKLQNLEQVHEFFLNRTFPPHTSPWELVLLNDPNGNGSLLALRITHILTDFKSMNKLIVECLGNKVLKAAQPAAQQNSDSSFWGYMTIPWNLVKANYILKKFQTDVQNHPFFFPSVVGLNGDSGKMLVGISEKIPLREIRSIARRHGVLGSAVIYSVIGGTLGRFGKHLGKPNLFSSAEGFPFLCSIPKPDHPNTFANHVYVCGMRVPTTMDPSFSTLTRVQMIHKSYTNVISGLLPKCLSFIIFQVGSLLLLNGNVENPTFTFPDMLPIVLSNVASDEEGFFVGSQSNFCEDFTFSCGGRMAGVGIIVFPQSYRDGLSFNIVASSKILTKADVKVLAKLMGDEFTSMKKELLPL